MMMAKASGKLMVIITVMVILGNFVEVSLLGINGDASPSECEKEKDLLVKECKPIILGSNPSGSCCQGIRVAHMECVCPLASPKIANLINIKRLVKQIKGCGRTLPHHFKCGSVTIP